VFNLNDRPYLSTLLNSEYDSVTKGILKNDVMIPMCDSISSCFFTKGKSITMATGVGHRSSKILGTSVPTLPDMQEVVWGVFEPRFSVPGFYIVLETV
jgi:hypothetical protein